MLLGHGWILSHSGFPATRAVDPVAGGLSRDLTVYQLRTAYPPPRPGCTAPGSSPPSAFVAILGAAGFRATPGVLIVPLQDEFGWSRGAISAAVSVNLLLYGLTAPFAAALMDRFGIRRVVAVALLLVAAGSGLTVFMTTSWQLVLCGACWSAWVPGRWRSCSSPRSPAAGCPHRGLVTGVLTAAGATGQLIFLPLLARWPAHGWRAPR